MRKQLVAAVLLTLAAGCTSQTDAGSSQTNDSDVSTSGWKLSRETTGMDGEIVSATRTFSFPDQATFNAEIVCRSGKSSLDFKIQSIVGDPETPSESSAFVSEQYFNQLINGWRNVPVVRVKIGEKSPVDSKIYTYFEMGDYSNQMKYSGLSLGQDIPMIVEVRNGAGTFELAIDASKEVAQVLDACNVRKNASSASSQPAPVQESLATGGSEALKPSEPIAENESTTPLVSPSFDCASATTSSEVLICSDATLARLDSVMAENFRAMMSSDIGDGARKELKSSQREWIVARDKCADKECMVNLYRSRLDGICDYPVISGVHPSCTTSGEIN